MKIIYVNPVGNVGGAEKVLLACIAAGKPLHACSGPLLIQFFDGTLKDAVERTGGGAITVKLPQEFSKFGDGKTANRSKITKFFSLCAIAVRFAISLPAFLIFLFRLRRAILRQRPTIIHLNGLKCNLVISLIKIPKSIPVIWHIQDYYSSRRLSGKLMKFASKSASFAIADSDSVRDDARHLMPNLKTQTILNAIDTDHYFPNRTPTINLDSLSSLPASSASTIKIGLIATYANWKGQDVFLEALAKLPQERNFRAYIIGGPIYQTAGSQFDRAGLEAHAAHLGLTGKVGFVPFQADPRDAYQALDIVVHASTRPEPFGLTIAEAMSCGKAVVVSAAGGASELFTEGIDALGHPPGDATKLAAAIYTYLQDESLRTRLGAAARITAVQRFSLPRYHREVADFYRQVAAPSR
jgi:glycosyltransferase involved in cell wall biosynthesis